MYLISIYFDKQTNKTLQWYIDKIAEKTNNHFMIENHVPPHMTIAAIEARNVNVLKPAFETLNGKLYSGSMKVVLGWRAVSICNVCNSCVESGAV